MFLPSQAGTVFPAVTETQVLIDLGRTIPGTEVYGAALVFGDANRIPDNVDLCVSSDNVTWSNALSSGGLTVPQRLERHDASGFSAVRYLRLTLKCAAPRDVLVSRWTLHVHEWSQLAAGGETGYLPVSRARHYGAFDIRSGNMNAGMDQSVAGLQIDGSTVITGAGGVRPKTDKSDSVGSAAFRYSEVFADTGMINTSDEREKEQIGEIPDEWLDAWGDVQWLRFKWRDAIRDKGASARWHIGLIAQRIRDAFSARGLDAFEIGLLCYDEWQDAPHEDDAPKVMHAAGDRFGVRYDEALAMEAAWVRRALIRMQF